MPEQNADKEVTFEQESPGSSGRWWEFYFVRYALGTVVGAIIVRFLATNGLVAVFPGMKTEKLNSPESAPFLLTYGLAYCYFASAPILILHAGRAIRWTPAKRYLLATVSIASGYLIFQWSSIAGNVLDDGNKPLDFRTIFFLAFSVVAFVALFVLQLFSLENAFSKRIWAYYIQLDKRRRIPANNGLVESYRHLREHGNAFLVVLCELLLALCLYFASHIIPAGTSSLPDCSMPPLGVDAAELGKKQPDEICTIPNEIVAKLGLLLFFWAGPAALVWPIGNSLEQRFALDKRTRGKMEPSAQSRSSRAALPIRSQTLSSGISGRNKKR